MQISLIDASFKAFRSLGTPGMLSIIVQTILLTLLGMIVFVIGASSLAFHMAAHIPNGALAAAIGWGGSIGSAVIAWMLFPGIMPVIVSFLDNKIAATIETQDYALTALRQPKRFSELFHDIGFGMKAILLNLLCLPLYLVPGVNLCIFYVLNGYLLGNEFFIMAARRHMSVGEAKTLSRKYASLVFCEGVMFVFLATIPFVNLIAPFWGVAVAVHTFHQIYAVPLIANGNSGVRI